MIHFVYSNAFIRNVNLGGSFQMNTFRLREYSILVSNDTVLPLSESSCYADPGNVTLPTIRETDFERTASCVWIYQSPMLEICELQVYGNFTFLIYILTFSFSTRLQNDSVDTPCGSPMIHCYLHESLPVTPIQGVSFYPPS